jgi:hypothetical protein
MREACSRMQAQGNRQIRYTGSRVAPFDMELALDLHSKMELIR